MCPARRLARRTASALLEVAMQSAFQEKCSYTMAVRCLVGELNSNASYNICSLEFFGTMNQEHWCYIRRNAFAENHIYQRWLNCTVK